MKNTVATLNLEFSLPDLDFNREHGIFKNMIVLRNRYKRAIRKFGESRKFCMDRFFYWFGAHHCTFQFFQKWCKTAMKMFTKLTAFLCMFCLTKCHESDKLNYDIKKFTSRRDGTSSSQLTSEVKSKKIWIHRELDSILICAIFFAFLIPIKPFDGCHCMHQDMDSYIYPYIEENPENTFP